MSIIFNRYGLIKELSDAHPIPVQQTLPPVQDIEKSAYSGTVTYNSSATMHGGAAGTPTVVGAVSARFIMVALQHRMASAAQTGNKLRIRRRYTAPDGSPYTTWTAYQDFTFDSTTTDDTKVLIVAIAGDSTSPTADEIELTIQNASVTSGNSLVWQAVVAVVR